MKHILAYQLTLFHKHAVGVILVRIAVYRNPEIFIEKKLWEKMFL